MSRLFFTFLNLFLIPGFLLAQAPSSFNYQAVARDEAGQPISGQTIGLQVSILQGSATGSLVYQEIFTPETNEFGLINLQIGNGQANHGQFDNIDWAQGPYFIQVGMDINGGSNFADMGATQLVSVPYALHALTAANAFSGDYEDLANAPDLTGMVTVTDPQEGEMLYFSQGAWNRIPAGQENQVLQFKNGKPQWASVAFGDHDLLPPTIVIQSTSGISHNTVTVHADVTDDGGANVTARGMVWNTEPNPGMDDFFSVEEGGTGTFSSQITGLNPETTYYIRAYATNGIGTSFSDQISITTEIESDDTTGTVTDSEGNVYNTILINGMWWMAENIRVRHYNDGSLIPTGFSNSDWLELTSGAWTYFNNDPAFDTITGKLYNYYAAADPRGICPVGWRLPTDQEIRDLRDELGGFQQAGGPMKATGTHEGGDGLWKEPNAGATNATGFTAQPTGARIHGSFFNQRTGAYFWTADEFDADFARNFIMVYDTSSLLRQNVQKHYGLAVRCVKN
jgi:uncharacterized protein (TIGR02145 family)